MARSKSDTNSDLAGNLEPGEVIDVVEFSINGDGLVRLRCSVGWVSLKPHLLIKLEEEEEDGVPPPVHDANDSPGWKTSPQRRQLPMESPTSASRRRHSVAVEGVQAVSELAEGLAKWMGKPGEQVFIVKQSHLPKAPNTIELKVGGMGVHLFDGPLPLGTFLYSELLTWRMEDGVLWLTTKKTKKTKSRQVGFKCARGGEIGKLMHDHATAMASQAKTDDDDGSKSPRGASNEVQSFAVSQSHLGKKVPKKVQLSIGKIGLQLSSGQHQLQTFRFVEIKSWGTDKSTISLKLVNGDDFTLWTAESKQISEALVESTLPFAKTRPAAAEPPAVSHGLQLPGGDEEDVLAELERELTPRAEDGGEAEDLLAVLESSPGEEEDILADLERELTPRAEDRGEAEDLIAVLENRVPLPGIMEDEDGDCGEDILADLERALSPAAGARGDSLDELAAELGAGVSTSYADVLHSYGDEGVGLAELEAELDGIRRSGPARGSKTP